MKQIEGSGLVNKLVVLAIICIPVGLLATPLILSHTDYLHQKGEGENAAKAMLNLLDSGVVRFYLDTGKVPESLVDLVEEPAYATGWLGPYVKKATLQDPWGNPFQYDKPGQHGDFDIYTFGADKREGGEGKNADHGNWDQ